MDVKLHVKRLSPSQCDQEKSRYDQENVPFPAVGGCLKRSFCSDGRSKLKELKLEDLLGFMGEIAI